MTTIMIKSPSAYFVFIPKDEDKGIPSKWLNLAMIYSVSLLNDKPTIELVDESGDTLELTGNRAQAVIDALIMPPPINDDDEVDYQDM